MISSRQIAGLIGPTLVVLATTETLNYRIWATSIPAVIYLNGMILFVAGLAIIRSHNRWTRDWTILVTLVGWVVFLAGLYRMFAPGAPQAPQNAGTFAGLALLLAVGLLLSFKAYWPQTR